MAPISYQYAPLDETKSQIRLLKIVPQSDSSLQYSLSIFDLEPSLQYIALSYTWGDDQSNHEITIDGQPLSIRHNLNSALLHLANLRRNEEWSEFRQKELYFWIDALCINQKDIKERNHQVAMMANIFTTAFRTIAWLGPEDDDFRILVTVDLEALQKSRHSRASYERQNARASDHEFHFWPFDHRPFDKNEEKLWHQVQKVLKKIAGKAYFTRMWILQEILLSRDLWAMCGNQTCAWQTLEACWLQCFDLFYKIPTQVSLRVGRFIREMPTEDVWEPLHSVMALRLMRNQQTLRLEDLLRLSSRRECTEPRDRIYALLGAVPRAALQSCPIKVDYGIHLKELYMLTRRHIYIHRHKGPYDINEIHIGGSGDPGLVALKQAIKLDVYEYMKCEDGFRRH